MDLPRLVLLATGGTIAGQANQPVDTIGYISGQIDIQTLVKQTPGLSQLAYVHAEQFCQIGSEDMTPALWLSLGKRVAALLEQPDVDGIVILHGTDTLEETKSCSRFLQTIVPDSVSPVPGILPRIDTEFVMHPVLSLIHI